jgi:hypothetical protein
MNMTQIFITEAGSSTKIPTEVERAALLKVRARDGQRGWILNVTGSLARGGVVVDAEPVNGPSAPLERAVRNVRQANRSFFGNPTFASGK